SNRPLAASIDVDCDLLEEFFSINGNAELSVEPGLTRGLAFTNVKKIKSEKETEPDVKKRVDNERDYAKSYVERERQDAIRNIHSRGHYADPRSTDTLMTDSTNLDAVSTILAETSIPQAEDERRTLEPYFDPTRRGTRPVKLAISEYREKIVTSVKINRVTIIEGDTGCGKTTQVPQYIADDCFHQGQYFNIAVTQPRRIAAISVAKRVCSERNWNLGEIVGYQVGMDKRTSENTRILYCTTGVLLQKLISQKRMDMFTHIIIDEVHERNEETDLLLMVVRKFMWSQPAPVRVIIMSATFDTDALQQYFAIPNPNNYIDLSIKPVVISITEKEKNYTLFYWNQLTQLMKSGELEHACRRLQFDVDKPYLAPETVEVAYKLIRSLDDMEGADHVNGAVLVFLPGYEEINEMMARLRKNETENKKWWILPLHSTITVEEQNRVFEAAKRGERKIILATNIAESSITVPDIEYVIDFCLTKNLVCDPDTNYPSLRLEWASKANCKQRSGRAGRCRQGRCYRLVPNDFYERYFHNYPIPELNRTPLESAVLKVKKLDLGPPKELLALCIEPPNLSDIRRAVLRLKEVGALTVTIGRYYDVEDGNLTTIGRIMALLPIDVQLSKLVILGHAFDCLDDCIIIAACLSVQNMFSRPYGKEIEAYKSKLAWADRTFSDPLAYWNAFRFYRELCCLNILKNTTDKIEWCNKSYIQYKRLRDVGILYEEIIKRLSDINIRVPIRPNQQVDISRRELVLKVVMCGAFYPNFFTRMDMSAIDIRRELHDKDPRTTVKISNLPQNEGVLYAPYIREMFAECSDQIDIEFEETHALLTFSGSRNPLEGVKKQQRFIRGRDVLDAEIQQSIRDTAVKTSVFIAMKRRYIGRPLEMHAFREDYARRKLEDIKSTRDNNIDRKKILRTNRYNVPAVSNFQVKQVDLPPIGVDTIKIFVTNIIECGHFWAQYYNDDTKQILTDMNEYIKNHRGRPLDHVTPGMLVLAPFENRSARKDYCRARVESVDDNTGITVFFIDYGNFATIKEPCELMDINENKQMPKNLKADALAFECQLCEIKPSEGLTHDGSWHQKANDYFLNAVQNNRNLTGNVYSVVDKVVKLELYINDPDTNRTININHELISLGFAEYGAESNRSKADHELRLTSAHNVALQNYKRDDAIEVIVTKDERGAVFKKEKIRIRGPYTPIEANYQGITKLNYRLKVAVERDSVNSVCLEANPEESQNRLMVAANVSLGGASGKIMARGTSLMPCIKGFAAMMALIFTPCCEFRTDENKYLYIGALCGLGFDRQTRQSYFKDNDMEVAFDVIFTETDIAQINVIRYQLSELLSTDEAFHETSGIPLARRQQSLIDKIFDLLSRKRVPLDIKTDLKYDFKWGCIHPDDIRQTDPNLLTCEHPFLNLHDLIEGVDFERYMSEVHDNVKTLVDMCRLKINQKAHCIACNENMYTLLDLSNHLQSKSHMDKIVNLYEPLGATVSSVPQRMEFDFNFD
ncbi:putative ATP-dependent RNA helicase TDRD9-like protein, partial [Dinothrombium tinctorium]